MSKSVKITGKVLVIQLGRVQTQLALLRNGTEVLYSTSLATPIGAVEDGMIQNPEAVERMLKDALRDPELKRVRKVVFSLCTSQAITEKVTTPDLSGAKLEKLILANADMYFPLDVQDHRLAWEVIGPKTSEAGLKELDVQLWALPNAVLAPYYTVANHCGLSVSAIDYCGHSVATVVGASFALPGKKEKNRKKLELNGEISFGRKKAASRDDEEEFPRPANTHTDMHILLESDVLGMTCVQNGHVVFQRFIRCGSDPSYQLSELAMMVDYFRAMDQGRGTSIVGILSGSLTNNRALVEELRDMLSISLGLLDIPYDLGLTCCIGAARTHLDFGIPSLNRPSKAMKEMRANLWQYALILVGGLMLISSVFSLLTARLTWNSNLTLMQSNVMLLQTESKKYDGYADNYESYVAAYNNYSSDWDSVFASLQANNNNLVKVLDELEELLPERATVTDMQIGATGMNVTFAVETKEQAAYMIMAMRDMEYADLLAVSSLSGGGYGPATSYGTGKTNEQAPVEGGTDISYEDRQRLKEALEADLDPFVVGYNLGLGEGTEDLLETVATIYGVTPQTSYTDVEDVPVTLQQRMDTLYTMAMSNPFAMRAAEDILYAHYKNGGELTQYVPQENLPTKWATHYNPTDLKKDLTYTLNEFYYHEEFEDKVFPILEQIITENGDAKLWYIYYLEGELDGSNPRPYMDLDKLVDGLVNTPNNEAYTKVNAVLTDTTLKYRILSDTTLAILDEITACDHVLAYAEPVTPTCTVDGHSGYWYCSTCQSMWQDKDMTEPTTADAVKLPAAHTALTQVAAKAPTATEDGWYAHWHCSDCGGYWTDGMVSTTWEALLRPAECLHSLTHYAAAEPTCDQAGNVEYWYCDICKTYWLDASATRSTTQAETVLAPEHGNVVAMEYKAPTETESGHYAYWTCTDCGGYWLDEALSIPTDFDSLIIAPNGCKHTLTHYAAIEPTCTTPGSVEYWFCTKCEMAWLDEAMTQATAPAATVLPAAHQAEKVEAKEATETEDGNVEHWYCAACQSYWLDEALTQPATREEVTLPATGSSCQHDVIPVEAREATCTEMGYNTDFWYCNTCQCCWLDAELTQKVPYDEVQIPAAHQAEKVEAKEATETEDGNVEHWYCASCDSYWLDEDLTQSATREEVTIPATGSSVENEMLKRLAEIMTTYLETGKTGLTEENELRVNLLIQQYMPGKTIQDVLDEQLTNYFIYGESDYPELDKAIEEYLAEDPEREEKLREKYKTNVSIEDALKEYLDNGTTTFDPAAIKAYLTTGDSGVEEFDERLDAYVEAGNVDGELSVLLLTTQFENKVLEMVIKNYREDSGNAVVNARLKICEEELPALIQEAAKHLEKYLANGYVDEDYDDIIKLFLTKGTFGDEELNAIFEKVIASDSGNKELTELIYLYAYHNEQMDNPQSVYYNNGVLDMLDNYHNEGTGSNELDKKIKYCYIELLDKYVKALEAAKAEAGKSSSGGTWQPQDKRTYFTVVLAYNDTLSNAELERKGLDPNEKLQPIGEVGEE